jgi:hypothetical protein
MAAGCRFLCPVLHLSTAPLPAVYNTCVASTPARPPSSMLEGAFISFTPPSVTDGHHGHQWSLPISVSVVSSLPHRLLPAIKLSAQGPFCALPHSLLPATLAALLVQHLATLVSLNSVAVFHVDEVERRRTPSSPEHRLPHTPEPAAVVHRSCRFRPSRRRPGSIKNCTLVSSCAARLFYLSAIACPGN